MDNIKERLIAETLSLTDEQAAFVLQRVSSLLEQRNDRQHSPKQPIKAKRRNVAVSATVHQKNH